MIAENRNIKKAAVMLYPQFSLQEISCLTELFLFYEKEIVTFSAGREAVRSEDGFTILPDRDFTSFHRSEFDCLVLPGIWEPLPVLLDKRNIRFLEQFQGDAALIIAAISSSPLLLGKAPSLPRWWRMGTSSRPMAGRFGNLRRQLPEKWALTARIPSSPVCLIKAIQRRTSSSTCPPRSCRRPGRSGRAGCRSAESSPVLLY